MVSAGKSTSTVSIPPCLPVTTPFAPIARPDMTTARLPTQARVCSAWLAASPAAPARRSLRIETAGSTWSAARPTHGSPTRWLSTMPPLPGSTRGHAVLADPPGAGSLRAAGATSPATVIITSSPPLMASPRRRRPGAARVSCRRLHRLPEHERVVPGEGSGSLGRFRRGRPTHPRPRPPAAPARRAPRRARARRAARAAVTGSSASPRPMSRSNAAATGAATGCVAMPAPASQPQSGGLWPSARPWSG